MQIYKEELEAEKKNAMVIYYCSKVSNFVNIAKLYNYTCGD
jgi:hypothetical protein